MVRYLIFSTSNARWKIKIHVQCMFWNMEHQVASYSACVAYPKTIHLWVIIHLMVEVALFISTWWIINSWLYFTVLTWVTISLQPSTAITVDQTNQEEESESLHTTLVLFSATDEFTHRQDMCLCCGSFGKGPEGQLIMCSQCGQSYHPYCVGVKVVKSFFSSILF